MPLTQEEIRAAIREERKDFWDIIGGYGFTILIIGVIIFLAVVLIFLTQLFPSPHATPSIINLSANATSDEILIFNEMKSTHYSIDLVREIIYLLILAAGVMALVFIGVGYGTMLTDLFNKSRGKHPRASNFKFNNDIRKKKKDRIIIIRQNERVEDQPESPLQNE